MAFRTFGSAPASSSTRTHFMFPYADAKCSAVLPRLSVADRSGCGRVGEEEEEEEDGGRGQSERRVMSSEAEAEDEKAVSMNCGSGR